MVRDERQQGQAGAGHRNKEIFKSVNLTNLDQLITDALAIEAQDAKEAGALGYMARALVQATLPHSKPDSNEFERRNGAFTLVMLAPSKVGLPYGVIPRLMMAWMTTEVVRTKQRELVLGDSMSEFMRQLDMLPTGGRWGSITRLREQSRRLFTTTISCCYEGANSSGEAGFRIADRHMLWWDPQSPEQKSLFNSTVTISERFYEEIRTGPVPVDLRAMKALKKSPLALDIYFWLTYRLSYLRQPRVIPWAALQLQFGSSYRADAHGLRDFKRAFLRELKKVVVIYPKAKVEAEEGGLLLRLSLTHIPQQLRLIASDR
jgi:hypothetical protein